MKEEADNAESPSVEGRSVASDAPASDAPAAAAISVVPVSLLAVGGNVAAELAVAVASALLLFVASQDGSFAGGRLPAAAAWVALWVGTVAARRPRVLPDAAAAGFVAAGAALVLLAPSVGPIPFLLAVGAIWIVLAAAFLLSRRTVLVTADGLLVATWLGAIAGWPPPLALRRGTFHILERPAELVVISERGPIAIPLPRRRLAEAAAVLRTSGADVTESA